eukprot:COSAG01_NODE_1265_length_10990_cov_23.579745_7_plen_281_part_00
MLAQNPDGDTITAQEFATARQDLTNLLQNPSGYVPEQVSAINERVQLQRQRQRERIARQQRFAQASNLTGVLSAPPDPGLGSVAFGLGSDQRNTITDFTDAQGLYATGQPLQASPPDTGLGSVAFGLGSDERNTITDFTDAQGLYATGEPLQAAAAAAEDQLYEPLTDQPDVETEEVFETPGFQGQADEADVPVDFGTPEQRQQQLQRFDMALDLARQLDSDLGRSGDLSLVTTIESNTPSQQERQEMPRGHGHGSQPAATWVRVEHAANGTCRLHGRII